MTARFDHLRHLVTLLRLAARTLRSFSDTDEVGGRYVSDVTKMARKIEDNAKELDDVAKKEVSKSQRSH